MERFLREHFFLGYLQAVWRGFSLRRRLACALAAVMCPDVGEEDVFEELDVDEFVLDEVRAQVHVFCFCFFFPFMMRSVSDSLTDSQIYK